MVAYIGGPLDAIFQAFRSGTNGLPIHEWGSFMSEGWREEWVLAKVTVARRVASGECIVASSASSVVVTFNR